MPTRRTIPDPLHDALCFTPVFIYRCAAVLPLGISLGLFGACSSESQSCPGVPCNPKAIGPVTFDLSCGPTDLTSVVVAGPCAADDASVSNYVSGHDNQFVSVSSPSPGTCHIELKFESGFTFSTDVTFGWQTLSSPPGCGSCPPYVGSNQGTVNVNNPSATCVGAETDTRSDGGIDAGDTE